MAEIAELSNENMRCNEAVIMFDSPVVLEMSILYCLTSGEDIPMTAAFVPDPEGKSTTYFPPSVSTRPCLPVCAPDQKLVNCFFLD